MNEPNNDPHQAPLPIAPRLRFRPHWRHNEPWIPGISASILHREPSNTRKQPSIPQVQCTPTKPPATTYAISIRKIMRYQSGKETWQLKSMKDRPKSISARSIAHLNFSGNLGHKDEDACTVVPMTCQTPLPKR